MRSRTRILVTHHLEVAQHADLIIVMDQGRVDQQGSFQELKTVEGTFRTLIEEYGHQVKERDPAAVATAEAESCKIPKANKEFSGDVERMATKLHLDEERNTGGVPAKTYIAYLKALFRGGPFVVSIGSAVFTECLTIALTLTLAFWATSSIRGFSRAHYMGLYATFGVSVSAFSYISSYSATLCGLGASFLMARAALQAVLRAPTGFHDRTPSGRIVSRLTKDIEALDHRLPFQLHYLLQGVLSIFGTMGLVFYSYAYLGIMFIPMFALYYIIGAFYSRTARETRRIDSNLRSHVFSTFGEQLSGNSSIRAYQKQEDFIARFEKALDNQGRIYYTALCQGIWLAIRLDILGNLLVLGIGIFAVCFRNKVSPAKMAVVLTYSLQTTRLFGYLILEYTRVQRGKPS
jgi:ATP-binding cassette subfamily C (CFTR/MRP) protein 1